MAKKKRSDSNSNNMTHNFQPVQRQPSPGKSRGEDNVNEFSVISDIFPVQNSEFTLVGDGDES